MRLDLEKWITKIEKDQKMANEQVSQRQKAFNAEMAQEGAELVVDAASERAWDSGKIRLV
jgi:hypothetical protein